jgi:hypothetical protein
MMPRTNILRKRAEPATNIWLTRSEVVANSINVEARTIDIICATDAAVQMRDYDGNFIEVLDFKATSIRLQRSAKGLPLLDNHVRYNGTKGVLGKVENIRVEGNKLVGTARFSKNEDGERAWGDVQDGILDTFSAGYKVRKYERVKTAGDDETPTYRAIDWEPLEVSLAPVPADYTATVRSIDGKTDFSIIDLTTPTIMKMTAAQRKKFEDAARAAGLTDDFITRALADDALTNERANELLVDEIGRVRELANQPNPDSLRLEGATAERERVRSINEIVITKSGLTQDFATRMINENKPIDQVRAAVIEELATQRTAPTDGSHRGASVGTEGRDRLRADVESLLLHRHRPDLNKLEGTARSLRGMPLMELAKETMVMEGIKVHTLNRQELALCALGSTRGLNSSTDFPLLLQGVVNKTLLREYTRAGKTFETWSRAATVKDFKPVRRERMGDLPVLKDVAEGAEYTYATVGESEEVYKVTKAGLIFGMTWEMMINDDMNAFTRIPEKMANSAAQREMNMMYDLLLKNNTGDIMGDNNPLFHATHGNIATTGALTLPNLALAREKMRKQKGLGGSFLNLTPSILIVGPANETVAQQLTSMAYVSTTAEGTNVFKGTLSVVVEPRITDNRWFLVATPGAIDTAEYATLEGEGGLFTESQAGFDIDGMKIKARHVFGCKAIDWKGFVKNAGA